MGCSLEGRVFRIDSARDWRPVARRSVGFTGTVSALMRAAANVAASAAVVGMIRGIHFAPICARPVAVSLVRITGRIVNADSICTGLTGAACANPAAAERGIPGA